ncbi:MAG: hypothetical protein Q7U20_02340 [Caulobacter sp.]|nr:hypothetical protein [Caulobacter sp.]
MWTRRAFAGLVAFGAATAASGVNAQASRPSRAGEADAIRRFAETTHPRGREAAADPAWQTHWQGLARTVDSLSDGVYVAGLRRGLAWFKDGHTTLLPFEFLPAVPDAMKAGAFGVSTGLRVRAFDDGLWVIGAGSAASALNGARVTAINGVPDVQILRLHVDGWAGENPAWAHVWAGVLTSSLGVLQGLGVVGDDFTAPLKVEAVRAGRPISVNLDPRPDGNDNRTPFARLLCPREGWAAEAGADNYVRPLADRRAIYLSVDEMGDVDGAPFRTVCEQTFKLMEDPAFDRLVVDLRRNGGGDNFLGEGLRKHVEWSRFNRPGGLFVLTSPQTFSAAQNLANRLERETFALFVGGPTGSAPNLYGDAALFTGKTTGVTAMVSTIPWFDSYPMDKRPWILPDLPVADRFEDWAAGRDPALELALTHAVGGEADDLSPARTFVYDRDSQKADWKPFWRA